jgi:hypothetical protein
MSSMRLIDAPDREEFEALEPITESQRELWMAAALGDHVNIAFNEGLVWTLSGPLDVAALERALAHIVERHQSLRACFSADGRFMRVQRNLPLALETISLQNDADPDAAVRQTAKQLTGTPLDLERGPLFRFQLLRVSATLHHLLFVAHHIVCDGWSYKLIGEELCELYNEARAGQPLALPNAAQAYSEYAQRERDFLASAEAREALRFWVDALRDAPAPLALPGDRPRPATRSYQAARYDHTLSAELTRALRTCAASQRLSIVTALFGGFAALAHRLTGDEDLVIGIASAGQPQHDLPRLVGHCVNFLPLRLQPHGAETLREFLRDSRSSMLDAVEHQGITFGKLLQHLKLKREPARPPLISVAMNLDGQDAPLRYDGLEVRATRIERQAENFELFLNVVDQGDTLTLQCSYNAQLFSQDAMRGHMQQYEALLRAMPAHLDTKLADLPIAAKAARRVAPSAPAVELRGVRIDLGEIEAALGKCEGVEACACDVRDRAPDDPRLVAWVQLMPEAGATTADLRQQLRERGLASHLLPQHFRVVDALDRAALPDPFSQADSPAIAKAPRTAVEEQVAAIWRDVLGHDTFGVGDRLLDVGGHSLLAVEVALKLRQVFGVKLLLREVMTGTLAQIATACSAHAANQSISLPAAAASGA